MYYLNKEYRLKINTLLKELPEKIKNRTKEWLLIKGYCRAVVEDETCACFATGISSGMLTKTDQRIHKNKINKFKKIFEKYYMEINNE